MPNKKIVFVIVEGPSDEDALGALLSRIYDQNSVFVYITHCDITTEPDTNPTNIVAKIGNLIRTYAAKIFRSTDFSQIIHITDTDGAFIPDDNVIEDDTKKKPYYSETAIYTCNKSGIEDRNHRKREILKRLASTEKIWNIPYRVYYMSCNLDHALYGKLNSTNKEKEENSLAFAKTYKDDIPAFLNFISKSDFSVASDYTLSWQYIQEELHSLERHTNFGLCFDKTESAI